MKKKEEKTYTRVQLSFHYGAFNICLKDIDHDFKFHIMLDNTVEIYHYEKLPKLDIIWHR